MTSSTIPERLRAACRGHPAASIPWPHRLLHEAADRIEELEVALGALPLSQRDLHWLRGALVSAMRNVRGGSRAHTEFETLLDRLRALPNPSGDQVKG